MLIPVSLMGMFGQVLALEVVHFLLALIFAPFVVAVIEVGADA
ncbi:hypothetical protein [Candidatus Regiella endosymbiont of Tuberolachnus salignus]